ncbi:MAG: hypothetical protein KAW12_30240 [Candidatus Aminicenantes bacterium]|nr:hypothetical protein [Candidatus Aminicenantes bacterium]
MKKKLTLLTIFVFLVITLPLCAFDAAEDDSSAGIDFDAGLLFSFNRAKVELGADKTVSTLAYQYMALEIDVEIFSGFTLGVIAGYNRNFFNDPVDFTQLPLTLRVEKMKNSSLLLGANLKAELFSFGDFTLIGKGEFLWFRQFNHESPIELSVVTGNAVVENAFYQATVDLLLKYDRWTGVEIFFGPELYLLDGEISADETIEDIQARQTLEYKQDSLFGFVVGASFEIGSHVELFLSAGLFSKTSFCAGLFYIF